MGINAANTFAGQFGSTFGRSNDAPAANDRPKAQYWLNLGYVAQGKDDSGNDTTYFVAIGGMGGQNGRSTLGGIALDSMSDFPLTGSANMQALRKQQNELRQQLIEAAGKLAPGESRIISTDPNTNLSIELRRVSAEVNAEDVETAASPVKLAF